MTEEPIQVAYEFARVLEHIGIPYLVGGSVASTFHGEPRATIDVDFVMHLDADQVPSLCAMLDATFYVDAEGALEAAEHGGHFNAVHLGTMIKVDAYARPREGLFAEEICRAHPRALSEDEGITVRVATAEDVVLQKLRWYRLGNCVSDRQWRDVVGVLKHVSQDLDVGYMSRWAHELELLDLLNEARREAGLDA